jgi:hypothetical protein
MARLFVRLIKACVKVFVTTHSDYIIKKLNNLIILGNEFEGRDEIMKKYKYTNTDVLEPSLVKVYIAEKQTLVPAPINELGIVIGSFDNEVREMKYNIQKVYTLIEHIKDIINPESNFIFEVINKTLVIKEEKAQAKLKKVRNSK